ncbi:hypothetical protein GCM10027447_26230 [Glycomyces halotolerans]
MQENRQSDVWYMELNWLHDDPGDPIAFYSEVGADGYEVRKVVRFRDGRLLAADEAHENDEVGVAEVPTDPPEVWNLEPEFQARRIAKQQFEKLWSRAELAPEWHGPIG